MAPLFNGNWIVNNNTFKVEKDRCSSVNYVLTEVVMSSWNLKSLGVYYLIGRAVEASL